jgi:hypothetical protein
MMLHLAAAFLVLICCDDTLRNRRDNSPERMSTRFGILCSPRVACVFANATRNRPSQPPGGTLMSSGAIPPCPRSFGHARPPDGKLLSAESALTICFGEGSGAPGT